MSASFFAVSSEFLKGVLPYVAPAWISLILAGLLLNSVLQCKSLLPRMVTDVMEYGKLRDTARGASFLSVPKRWVGVQPLMVMGKEF